MRLPARPRPGLLPACMSECVRKPLFMVPFGCAGPGQLIVWCGLPDAAGNRVDISVCVRYAGMMIVTERA